ncbi:hypothetical protein KIH74_13060 [Kineosporia sp. J2-2]|uniref:Uncharacterized protein n=1 Tax=Kineosporia corallincola TaxID=2835133 RepID=A0ABS5TFJ3_9ACTN|nr:DUF5825 family protein [Kineosporia corallincola]MBT0769860.1 hypothetical protein [Kineosporia corallincola]
MLAELARIAAVLPGPLPDEITIDSRASDLARIAGVLGRVGPAGLTITVRTPTVPLNAGIPAVVGVLAHAQVAALEITRELVVGGPLAVAWTELAKAALSHGLPLRWSGAADSLLLEHFTHLVPPQRSHDWRRAWRYGALTWRRGPGFALVNDDRNEQDRRRHTVDLLLLTGIFGPDLDRPAQTSADPGPVIDELIHLGLAARLPNGVVWLPYRMRRFPAAPP